MYGTHNNISGHMLLDTLTMAPMWVVPTTAPVHNLQVELLLILLESTITLSLVSLMSGKAAIFTPLMIHCGTVMDVLQATAAATRLGCHGSTGPSHRKRMVILKCAVVVIYTTHWKRPIWSWWRSTFGELNVHTRENTIWQSFSQLNRSCRNY